MGRGVEACRRGQEMQIAREPEGLDKWRRGPTAPVAHDPAASGARVYISTIR